MGSKWCNRIITACTNLLQKEDLEVSNYREMITEFEEEAERQKALNEKI